MKHVVRLTWIAALLILLTSYLQPVASTFLTGTGTAAAQADLASSCQPPTPPTQEARLPAPSFGVDARFGYNVVLYGDTLVVGAHLEDHTRRVDGVDRPDAGAVYVYVRDGGAWTQQARLTASNADEYDGFGYAVALHQDTLAVGAIYERSSATGVDGDQADNGTYSAGAVYVFTRTGGTWSQQAYVKASNTGFEDHFGDRIALYGDTLVVGVESEDSSGTGVDGDQSDDGAEDSGAVYVFEREGGAWAQQAYLKSSNSQARDWFGRGVAVFEDTLVVGARGEDSGAPGIDADQTDESASGSGVVYVFTRAGATWTQQTYVKSPAPAPNDGFGGSVALDGDTLVVGAAYDDGEATDSGAVFVYERAGRDWTLRARLTSPQPAELQYFGSALSLHEDALAVGVPFDAGNASAASGAVYLFRRCDGAWSEPVQVTSAVPRANNQFGRSVALHGGTLVVGAYMEGNGAAYVFR